MFLDFCRSATSLDQRERTRSLINCLRTSRAVLKIFARFDEEGSDGSVSARFWSDS